jgi:hypothetical protein
MSSYNSSSFFSVDAAFVSMLFPSSLYVRRSAGPLSPGGYDPDCVDYARYVAEQGEQNVQEELHAQAGFHEDTNRWQDYGQNDF